ncbi:hypothetical protein NKH77_53125 [Streptomyces sp. M19]
MSTGSGTVTTERHPVAQDGQRPCPAPRRCRHGRPALLSRT